MICIVAVRLSQYNGLTCKFMNCTVNWCVLLNKAGGYKNALLQQNSVKNTLNIYLWK